MKKIIAWAKRRLSERSTWIGLATIAAAAGVPGVSEAIGQVGAIVTVALGSGLVAASTSASITDAA